MTEYGRGYGSEPWHPEDPLYGDQGPHGGQAQQPQWGDQQSAPQQSGYPQQQYDGRWDGTGSAPSPYDPYDPYGQQQPADPYGQQGHDPYGHQGAYQQQTQQMPPVPGHQQGQTQQMPPVSGHQQGQTQQMPQVSGHPQQYAPPQYDQQPAPHYDDAPTGDDWRADPEPRREPEPDHPFFAEEPGGPYDDGRGGRKGRDGRGGREDDYGDDYPDDHADEDDERGSGRERRGKKDKKNKKKKRRSGTACLVVTLVFAGAVGVVGYFGYDFFMAHFGSSPDYEGEGSGAVQVEIPNGSPIGEMGQILAKKGVIKSAGAFTEAADGNKKATLLQPGTYSLRKQMSAAAALELMADPKSRNGLTIREGLRAGAVYSLIDQKLKLKAGTTKDIAKRQLNSLGLPDWANDSKKIKDPLEGFLYPSTYSVGGNAKPEDVLKQMVGRATQEYAKYDLAANAKKFHLTSPLQLLTVASLTQAEGMTHDDFRKMAAVVYNRLAPSNTDTNQKLEFDSAFNYLKNQSKINISTHEIRNYDDPYNTYFYRGLPPGPIGNPGEDALKATINPDNTRKWLYFISVDGKKTDFTTNLNDHMKLVRKFNERQKTQKQSGN
ncbi:endolytic transglycosylase MltG [Streptomyces sp. NPDC020742]|uniref:endolytic transglycosylase MltG n=1 Tax=Streptomyces sp. NPDC020742 TaxID=3154897 RepID=UPI0033E4E922